MSTDREPLRHALAAMVADASDGDVTAEQVLAADCPLRALGITSITQIRLVDAIEDTFGIDIDLAMIDRLDTMVEFLASHGAEVPSGAER